MHNITSWLLFGLLIGIVGSTFDMPLRMNKLVFSLLIGVAGSLIGGMVAYFIYGMELQGVNIATLTVVLFGSVAAIFLHKLSDKSTTHMRGGE
jgi:uncharacterized membrane protein YeaQ/YmgE (transglycosylase-associated protein family)